MIQKENDITVQSSQENIIFKSDYFTELMRLRQRWRVKKTANVITGDLSYKNGKSVLIQLLLSQFYNFQLQSCCVRIGLSLRYP